MRELLTRIDSSEFAEWIAYSRIDPFGNERADMHAAMIVSMLYNINRGRLEVKQPADFMPNFEAPRPAGEQVLSAFKSLKSMEGE